MLPVVAHREKGTRYRELVLRAPELAAGVRPGQFVNVRCAEGYDPLLRRPFSVYRVDRSVGTVSILYEVVGRGTALMAAWQPGFEVDVLGPLGNWFEMPPGHGAVALVAGGIGVAPLVAFADAAAPAGRPLRALLGARSAGLVPCEEDFQSLGVPVSVATDDGTRGHHGFVSGLVDALLRGGARFDAVLTCGPRPMMAATAAVAAGAGIPCFVSMEVGMACGFGVCMGCAWRVVEVGSAECEVPSDTPANSAAVRSSGLQAATRAEARYYEPGPDLPSTPISAPGQPGAPAGEPSEIEDRKPKITYRLVCTDGPVFNAAEIVWDAPGAAHNPRCEVQAREDSCSGGAA